MDLALKNLKLFRDGALCAADILVRNGRLEKISPTGAALGAPLRFDLKNTVAFPGFTDVHVHLREPGFSYKETIRTGTLAAARGGYTAVCAMPNLNPMPDCPKHLAVEFDIIRRTAMVNVHPYGTITTGQRGETLADMAGIAKDVVAFSDDGRGVQNEGKMREAMEMAKRLDKIIAAHCEDDGLLRGGYIHAGSYAARHGHRGIVSQSEWGPIARDLRLAEETGCRYHVCHVSCSESVELIRQAKRRGVDVSCETAPHYLLLNDEMLKEDGRFKMNPPIRSEADRQALIEGLQDGTIDMIATDHAPHSPQEKAKGLMGSLNGVVGLETAFAVLYTGLVRTGRISLARLIELLHTNPNRRFGIGTPLEIGQLASLTVFDLEEEYPIDPGEFLSLGKSTPFAGMRVWGRCKMTLCDGQIVWKDKGVEECE